MRQRDYNNSKLLGPGVGGAAADLRRRRHCHELATKKSERVADMVGRNINHGQVFFTEKARKSA